MRAIYYDTETTGTKPGKDRVVELAAYDPVRDKTFCTFIDPEMEIPSDATAISGITNEMVKGAPLFGPSIEEFISFCGEEVVLIAHNNDSFDKLFLEEECRRCRKQLPSWKYIDSLKWARKYRSDLPRHSLQFLREAYGIGQNQAHRALDDVIVLYQVFSRMTDDLPLSTIMELLEQKQTLTRMPFGKHQGKPLAEVPKNYVEWLDQSGALAKPENGALKEQFINLGHLRPTP